MIRAARSPCTFPPEHSWRWAGSVATLEDNCTITINVNEDQLYTKLYQDETGPLAQIRAINDPAAMVQKLVELFDGVVGVVDASNTVTVNIVFGEAAGQ